MVPRSLAALALLSLAALAAPAQAQGLRSFEEREYGTLSLVPSSWRRVADPRWEGSRFVSPDGRSSLVVYALPRRGGESVEDHMRWFAQLNGEEITYRRRGRSWIVVSGYKGDRIYYRKARLGCGGAVWHHIALEYPLGNKRAYDGIVTAISHSLQPSDAETGCERFANGRR